MKIRHGQATRRWTAQEDWEQSTCGVEKGGLWLPLERETRGVRPHGQAAAEEEALVPPGTSWPESGLQLRWTSSDRKSGRQKVF